MRQTGNLEFVEKLQPLLTRLPEAYAGAACVSEPEGGLLTTGEAAEALGVRSVNTINRWAIDGALEGYRRRRRVLISARSVERLRQTPSLAEQILREKQLAENLAALDLPDDIPPM